MKQRKKKCNITPKIGYLQVSILLGIVMASIFSNKLYSQIPDRVNYQGRYFVNNEPVNGTIHNCFFRITDQSYDGSTGVVYYTEGPVSLDFENGLFNYQIRCGTVSWRTPPTGGYYLAVHIDNTYIGKERIESSVYSFYATSAAYAYSAPSPANMVTTDTNQTITGVKTFTSSVTITASEFSVGSSIFVVVSGRVGIGTTGPSSRLDIFGGSVTIRGSNAGLRIESFNTAGIVRNDSGGNLIGGGSLSSSDLPEEISVSTINARSTTPFGGIHITSNVYVSGKVGVGTTTPLSSFHINGDLRVNDSVITDEANNTIIKPKNNQLNIFNTDWSSIYCGPIVANGDLSVNGYILSVGSFGSGCCNFFD